MGDVCKPVEIHRQVTEVFIGDVTTAQFVGNGAHFETGGPNHYHGRASTSRFDVKAARIRKLILLNRQVAIRNLSAVPELLIGTLQNCP